MKTEQEIRLLQAECEQLRKHLSNIKDRDNAIVKYEVERTNKAESCLVRAYRALFMQKDLGEPYRTHSIVEDTIKYIEDKYPDFRNGFV